MEADYSKWELVRTFQWDSMELTGVALSPDGTTVAVVGGSARPTETERGYGDDTETGFAQLWDIETGEAKLSLTDPSDKFKAVAFYPDGLSLALGDRKKTKIVDARSGALKMTLPQASYFPMAFNRQEKIMATGPYYFWNSLSGQLKPSVGKRSGDFVAFSPDGTRLYIDGELWWVKTGTECGTLLFSSGGRGVFSRCAAFSHDGKLIGTGWGVWRADGGAAIWEVPPNRAALPTGVVFTPDDKALITSNYDGFVEVWDTGSGRLIDSGHPHETVAGIALSPDGKMLVTVGGKTDSDNAPIKLWRVGMRPSDGPALRQQ